MLNSLVCGAYHGKEEDEGKDKDHCKLSCPSTPKKSKKWGNRDRKNLYSSRGLDKFAELLAELDSKRQKIYSQMGSQDTCLVRFVYSNTNNDVVPVVIKVRDHNQQKPNTKKTKKIAEVNPDNCKEIVDNSLRTKASSTIPMVSGDETEVVNQVKSTTETMKKSITSRVGNCDQRTTYWRRPSRYVPVFLVLILLLLAISGKSFAILCTSICWYLVPTLSNSQKQFATKNNDLVRRISDIN